MGGSVSYGFSIEVVQKMEILPKHLLEREEILPHEFPLSLSF